MVIPAALFGVWVVALSATCALAIFRGDQRSRRFAAIAAGAWLASLAAQALARSLDPAAALVVVDLIAVAMMVVAAWKTPMIWPYLAICAQTLAVALDALRLFQPGLHGWAYLSALGAAGYGVLAAVAIGTLRPTTAASALEQ